MKNNDIKIRSIEELSKYIDGLDIIIYDISSTYYYIDIYKYGNDWKINIKKIIKKIKLENSDFYLIVLNIYKENKYFINQEIVFSNEEKINLIIKVIEKKIYENIINQYSNFSKNVNKEFNSINKPEIMLIKYKYINIY
jgi:hypothetical protein